MRAHAPRREECSAACARRVLLACAVLPLALPVTAEAYRERLILAREARSCTLRLEADDEARSLRLRVLPEDSTCHVSKEEVQAFLREAFTKSEPPKLEGTWSSLALGRLVHYPWLASYVASAAYEDRGWDTRRGKPVRMDINAYVAALLSRREVTAQLGSAIQGSGHDVASAVVEKVLVGGFRDVPRYEGRISPGKVPFDAQVWFKLEKR